MRFANIETAFTFWINTQGKFLPCAVDSGKLAMSENVRRLLEGRILNIASGLRLGMLGKPEGIPRVRIDALIYCTFTAPIRNSLILNGAGEGNRTLVSGLGSPRSAIEPHPLRLPQVLAGFDAQGNCSVSAAPLKTAASFRAARPAARWRNASPASCGSTQNPRNRTKQPRFRKSCRASNWFPTRLWWLPGSR